MKIAFSAPAKIHLLGEHAVVYGKPAIISATNLRLTLTLIPAVNSNQGLKTGIHKIQTAIEKEIKKVYKPKRIPPYQIEINSNFPLGSGLGGSAAISATLSAALLKLLKTKAQKQQIYDIAIAGEKAIHGNPSGSDLAAVIFGGTLWFRKELPILSLTSQISPTFFTPRSSASQSEVGPTLFLINSGKPVETTGEMVAKVARLPANLKKETFNQLELLAKNLASGGNIKQIFKEAHHCLVKLGVVGKNAQNLVKQIEKSGGAAKITGGGGYKTDSGMLLIYHPHPKKLKSFKLIKIKIGQEGLRSEA